MLCLGAIKFASYDSLIIDFLCLRTRLWFISFILYMYAAYYLFTRYIYSHRIMLFAILGTFFLLFLKGVEGEQGFSFLIGMLISEKKQLVQKFLHYSENKQMVYSLAFGLLGVAFLAIKQLPVVRMTDIDAVMNFVQTMIKLPIALSLLIMTMNMNRLHHNRFLTFCGKISYELYLIHFSLFFNAFWIIFPKDWNGLILVCLTSFLLSWLFMRINNYTMTLVLKNK